MNPDLTAATPVAAVVYDADACRAWLTAGADDEHRVADMSTTNITMAAGMDRLLETLDLQPEPAVWKNTGAITRVRAVRTADGDGTDGGAIITIDLTLGGHQLRLATDHLGYDHFTHDGATRGIDAAVQALATVANHVNTALADLTAALGVRA
jgi:predicted mannosyl-3-phosphoglycerate phosphatase (HAD superfamily)